MMKKKKRMLSLLLAVIMTLSMWSVPVFAEEMKADMEIKSGGTIEVTGVMTVKFVPEKSGTYYFMSESRDADPITYLYKGNAFLRSFDDDSLPGMEKENDRDFQASYNFTAGETYYFNLGCWNSFSNYQFTIASNLIKHQPESAEPFVGMTGETEDVTYQWYELEEITPASADVATYEGNTSSYDEETGWIPALTEYGEGYWYADFLKKDFVTGESITVKLDGSFGDDSYVELEKETGGDACIKDISGKTGGSYTLTAPEKGTYQLFIDTTAEEEPDVTLRAYSEGTRKLLAGETESTLKNPETGKAYSCRIKLADGSFMDSKSFVYEYCFSHQPAETEPYVEGSFEGAEGVTYQWYAVSGQEVTPGSVAYVRHDSTYSAVDGWSDGNYYDNDNAYYWYGMFEVELKAGQLLKVETKGTVEDFISLYSYDKSDTVYSLNPTDREDDTYIFTITEDDIYELDFHAGTDDVSVKAYVLDSEKSSEAVEGETESRLKEPAIGNYYFCRVMTDEGILNSEMFYYDYAITHYPTLEEPRVEMNETEGVTYQWYELDVSGAEKITSECENIVAMGGYYEEGRGWIGYQEPANDNPENTYYDIFYIYLEEGQTLTVLPKGEVADGIGIYGLNSCWEDGSGIGNDLYRLKAPQSGRYELCFYGTTEDIAVEAWIGDVTMKPLEGETQNTLSDDARDGLFCCMVKGENGKELQTGYIDRTYRITVQPVNGAASVQVNYPEDVAEIRWYRGTFGEEITPSAITPSAITPSAVTSSAVTSSAVSGAALYPYDAEKGWTGKWEQRGEGYTAEFLKVALSTGESISIVMDGTQMDVCGLHGYKTYEGYYKELGEETGGICSFTVKKKDTYVLYALSQTTDAAIRAYRGEITYSPLKDQNNFRLYNAEDGVYCCEVEYRNGKTIRSKTVFLEDIETLNGAANPVISQSEPGTISTSWSAADNASGYAVSLYRNGEVAESCTSAALSHTFDITEKGSYFFTVKAEGREGVYINDATVTSAALNIYGVTFDTNGGGTTPEALLVAEGEKITGPAVTPSKDGYTFDGWYNGEEKWDFGNGVTSDLVLTAKWTLAGILGDVDGSGDIKAEDALMVLKSVAHMVTLTTEEEKLADVDKSGDVKAEDALLILKYVAHMVSGF